MKIISVDVQTFTITKRDTTNWPRTLPAYLQLLPDYQEQLAEEIALFLTEEERTIYKRSWVSTTTTIIYTDTTTQTITQLITTTLTTTTQTTISTSTTSLTTTVTTKQTITTTTSTSTGIVTNIQSTIATNTSNGTLTTTITKTTDGFIFIFPIISMVINYFKRRKKN